VVFAPSLEGSSHTKEEYTSGGDIVKGLLVLAETTLRLDKKW